MKRRSYLCRARILDVIHASTSAAAAGQKAPAAEGSHAAFQCTFMTAGHQWCCGEVHELPAVTREHADHECCVAADASPERRQSLAIRLLAVVTYLWSPLRCAMRSRDSGMHNCSLQPCAASQCIIDMVRGHHLACGPAQAPGSGNGAGQSRERQQVFGEICLMAVPTRCAHDGSSLRRMSLM